MFANNEGLGAFILRYKATVLIVVLCSLLTLYNVVMFDDYTAGLIQLGALDKALIEAGEIWRLLTYAFSHMSVFHFCMNILFLLYIARPLERFYGSARFFIVYILLAIISGVIIYFLYTGSYPLAGLSGAGYGLLGIYLFYALRFPAKFSPQNRKFILVFIAIGIVLTFVVPNITYTGHIGGLISGVVVAWLTTIFNKKQIEKSFY
ncbi:Rhomboid protease GluP [Metalysinibacillus saudimassiliensis]|uniref:Rhomboid protease GluP n=1 Tax=Metalysinibacillus saudimassiliensis TaxID=1461583 RepID=A0A078LYV7_9BACL|nr:Rhomboid protease GluP [Metalysinibacillus saudimassiliensis]